MNQLIVLLIFGAIALINYLIRQSASAPRKPGGGTGPSNLPPRPQRPVQTTGQSGDDERLRKFMEALGVPAQAAPPPPSRKVIRPAQAPPRVLTPVRRQARIPGPVSPPAWNVPVQQISTPPPPAPAQPAYQAETVGMPSPSTTAYDIASPPPAPVAGIAPSISASAMGTDLKSLLKSSSSIRTAILLKEILGAPRGLQAAEVIPGLR
jgi:hypothetical protein